jgi:hypothetical protein
MTEVQPASEEGQEERRKFKPHIYHLYPILFSFIATGILGYPIFLARNAIITPQFTYFPDNPIGAGLNALVFVATLTVSATGMLLLVRRRKKRALQGLVKAGLILMSFVVALWYGSTIASIVNSPISDIEILLASIGIAAVLASLVYGKHKVLQAFGVTSVGAATGLFLGASIPLLTSLAILVALVLYDTVSVFRGPIGALARNVEVGDLTGAVFNYRDLTIGMGDIVFYSLVETVALLNFGIPSFLAAGAGVIIGAYLGFRALSRYQVFPGLPFALLLGAGGMLAVALAQGLPI